MPQWPGSVLWVLRWPDTVDKIMLDTVVAAINSRREYTPRQD